MSSDSTSYGTLFYIQLIFPSQQHLRALHRFRITDFILNPLPKSSST